MINAAHASDSQENARQEMGIIAMEENSIQVMVEKHWVTP